MPIAPLVAPVDAMPTPAGTGGVWRLACRWPRHLPHTAGGPHLRQTSAHIMTYLLIDAPCRRRHDPIGKVNWPRPIILRGRNATIVPTVVRSLPPTLVYS
jgi:hypothetical protein